ncbi:hypothetical protein HYW20_06020 [Candidatus Woesearchaeota archaeon]|nr:hypothetical protein [Candidatus Woesearchaeota archaeon]
MNYKIIPVAVMVLISLSIVIAYDLSEYPKPFIKNGKFDGVLAVGDNAPADDVVALSNIIASLQYSTLENLAQDNVLVDTLAVGEIKTYSFNNIDYETTLNFVELGKAQFIINGWTSNVIKEGKSDILVDGRILTLAKVFNENGIDYATFSLSDEEINIGDYFIEVGAAMLASEVEDIKNVNSILVGHACDNFLVAEVSGRDNCEEGYEKNVGSIESYQMSNGKISIVVTGYSESDTLNAANLLSSYETHKESFKGNAIKVKKDGSPVDYKPIKTDTANNSEDDGDNINFKFSIAIFLVMLISLIVLFFYSKTKKR